MSRPFIDPEMSARAEGYDEGFDRGLDHGYAIAAANTAKLCAKVLAWCERHGHTLPPTLNTQLKIAARAK